MSSVTISSGGQVPRGSSPCSCSRWLPLPPPCLVFPRRACALLPWSFPSVLAGLCVLTDTPPDLALSGAPTWECCCFCNNHSSRCPSRALTLHLSHSRTVLRVLHRLPWPLPFLLWAGGGSQPACTPVQHQVHRGKVSGPPHLAQAPGGAVSGELCLFLSALIRGHGLGRWNQMAWFQVPTPPSVSSVPLGLTLALPAYSSINSRVIKALNVSVCCKKPNRFFGSCIES